VFQVSLNEAGTWTAAGLRRACLVLLAGLLVFSACGPPATETGAQLQKDVKALKEEVAALKEKVNKLEAGQKELQVALLKPGQKVKPVAPPPAPPAKVAAPLSVAQLLKNKDRLLDTRVTVKGQAGPVLMHKKILYLQGPEGMVEVSFAQLADPKQIERLNTQAIEGPVTVVGRLTAAPGQVKEPTRLVIVAESVEF